MPKLAKIEDQHLTPVCFLLSQRDTDSTQGSAENKRELNHRCRWFQAGKSYKWLARVVYQAIESGWVTESEHAK